MSKFFGFIGAMRTPFSRRSAGRAKKSARKPHHDSAAQLLLEELETRTLLTSGMGMGMGGLDPTTLVSYAAVTDTAIRTGNWSSPFTWQSGHLPGANANVLIPMGLTVTVDGVEAASLHTIRVDGTLQYATAQNTGLSVDTVVVSATGTFDMGTAAQPVAAANKATLTFTDSGPIDTMWDPYVLSRGLISMGTVNIYGATTTSFLSLTGSALKGATQLTLSQAPTNWKVGDQFLLPGTNPLANEDENLTILAISGTKVTVSPLAYNHTAATGQSVYVTDLTRNVVLQSANPADIAGRGHVMFMSQMDTIGYAAFSGLGRTNKLVAVTDPQVDAMGNAIASTDANPRGRYAVHFHHTGTDSTTMPATVTGCVVNGSPGWGYVNHDSYVNFQDDVSYNAVGAGFVTEAGSEIGSFTHNLAVRDTGDGTDPDSRKFIQDWGHAGDGFWFEGAGIDVKNNVAVGQGEAGFEYYTIGMVNPDGTTTVYKVANLPNPSLVTGGVTTVAVGSVPMRSFTNNTTYGSMSGVIVRYHLGLPAWTGGMSVIDHFTGWNINQYGATFMYASHVTLQNSTLLGDVNHPNDSVYGVRTGIEAMNDLHFVNLDVEGFQVGIRLAPVGSQYVVGGYFNNVNNIDVRLADNIKGTSITLNGNIQFGTLSSSQLSLGTTQYNIYMDGDFTLDMTASALPLLFTPQQSLFTSVVYNGQQLYFKQQAASYVPFPKGQTSSFVPAQLVGKTNQQLWSQYGLAIGGSVAPASAKTDPHIYGLIGTPMTPVTSLKLLSAPVTSLLTGYQLVYQDTKGKKVVSPTIVTLAPGWNLFTITLNGVTTTFFVYGQTNPSLFVPGINSSF